MPLTPADVRNKQFSTTRLRPGYDEEEVDAFLDEVEAELDRLIQENEELRAKLAECLRGKVPAMAAPIVEPKADVAKIPEPPRPPEPVQPQAAPEPAPAPGPPPATPRSGPARSWARSCSSARSSSARPTTCAPSSGSPAAASRSTSRGSCATWSPAAPRREGPPPSPPHPPGSRAAP